MFNGGRLGRWGAKRPATVPAPRAEPAPTKEPAKQPPIGFDWTRSTPSTTTPPSFSTVFPPGGTVSPPQAKWNPEPTWNPGAAVGPNVPPPEPTEAVRRMLEEQGWQLPTAENKAPKEMELGFQEGGITSLKQHDYKVSQEEWNRIKSTYSGPAAVASGYRAPASATASLDVYMPLMNLGEQESAALTWDAYEALSKDQRAAVDLNTLLVEARENDLFAKVVAGDANRREYDERVAKLFGSTGGSEVYAPNTLGLLEKLDMSLVGQDIDEYLSLERAIDTTELADFKFSERDVMTLDRLVNGKSPTYAQVRTPENMAAVDTAGIQKAQQVIKTALTSPEAMTYDINTLVFGPSHEMAGQPPIGFGDTTTKWANPNDAGLNDAFQYGLTMLGSKDPEKEFGLPAGSDPMGLLLQSIYDADGTDEDRQKLLIFLQSQIDLAAQYGTEEDATTAALISKRAGLGG